jgi:hypothetical protein
MKIKTESYKNEKYYKQRIKYLIALIIIFVVLLVVNNIINFYMF